MVHATTLPLILSSWSDALIVPRLPFYTGGRRLCQSVLCW